MKSFTKDNQTGVNHEGKYANRPLKYLTSSSICKDDVYNHHEEKLGSIKDLMVDLETGKIEYVVIEMGGFLGIGEKFFAVPFQLLAVDSKEEAFILNQDKETLENAPGFDKDHWPLTNDHYQTSTTYWGGFMGPNTGSVPY
jgi:sporulation protein YlmC with PRC-barrel domain